MIRMALSKNPNPINGIALWNATDEGKNKNMSEIHVSDRARNSCKIFSTSALARPLANSLHVWETWII